MAKICHEFLLAILFGSRETRARVMRFLVMTKRHLVHR
jgi:hypothetical protein